MILRKQEMKKFIIWMRNGISFAVTWFLILLLAGSYGLNIPQIAVATLTKMVVIFYYFIYGPKLFQVILHIHNHVL